MWLVVHQYGGTANVSYKKQGYSWRTRIKKTGQIQWAACHQHWWCSLSLGSKMHHGGTMNRSNSTRPESRSQWTWEWLTMLLSSVRCYKSPISSMLCLYTHSTVRNTQVWWHVWWIGVWPGSSRSGICLGPSGSWLRVVKGAESDYQPKVEGNLSDP